MMYELRILSGLHRGATLPLDDQSQIIGASDDADVVLVDPDIEAQHATLTLTETGWMLSALDGGLYSAENNRPHTVLDLMPGDFARVGNIWVTVVDSQTRWGNPPPEPIDMGMEPSDSAQEEALSEMASSATQTPDAEERNGRRGRRFLYIPFVIATALSAAAAYSMTSTLSKPAETKTADIRADLKARVAAKGGTATAADTGKSMATATPALTPEELRQAFRKRLTEADLLKRFDLTLDDQSWSMQGALDDEEAARFERILTSFVSTHRITFPVNAKVGNAETMLPFKIRQVIFGANASVVTHEGDRLYVGDEYRGVRVAAIKANHVVFTGKRKIEVRW